MPPGLIGLTVLHEARASWIFFQPSVFSSFPSGLMGNGSPFPFLDLEDLYTLYTGGKRIKWTERG